MTRQPGSGCAHRNLWLALQYHGSLSRAHSFLVLKLFPIYRDISISYSISHNSLIVNLIAVQLCNTCLYIRRYVLRFAS